MSYAMQESFIQDEKAIFTLLCHLVIIPKYEVLGRTNSLLPLHITLLA
jgi:hypothetical protein